MFRIAILSVLIFVAGCQSTNYKIDTAKVKGCENFDWDGEIHVSETEGGLFTNRRLQSLKLRSTDGRVFLIVFENPGVKAYTSINEDAVEMKGNEDAGKAEQPRLEPRTVKKEPSMRLHRKNNTIQNAAEQKGSTFNQP